MPKRWTQPRFTVSLLEKPTLKGYGRRKRFLIPNCREGYS